jgi:hypothetical protein
MMSSNNKGFAASLAMGAIFIVLGILEIAAGWIKEDWMNWLSAGGNFVLGLVLMVIGAVFLFAARGFRSGRDGDAFLMVGCGLALFIGLVALLTLAANASEAYLLGNEDFAEWSPVDDFSPTIVMMVPALALLYRQLKAFWAAPEAKAAEVKQ